MSEKLVAIKTTDSSFTLYSEKFKQHYHNINGAVTETLHIYVGLGIKKFKNSGINILEVGYGTGLNAILSCVENLKLKNSVFYHGIDISPIESEIFEKLEYNKLLNNTDMKLSGFVEDWNRDIQINKDFILRKQRVDIADFHPDIKYDLIYFDAFSPDVQPEMWTEKIFKRLSEFQSSGGILLTYCSKGIVKKNLREAGYCVKRLNGPPGKRHVICATKM